MKTLKDIVDDIHKNDDTGLTKAQIEAVTNNLVQRTSDSLVGGEEVRMHNLGTFTLNHRDARMGRNPATGEQVQIAAKTSVKFKASKSLADRVA